MQDENSYYASNVKDDNSINLKIARYFSKLIAPPSGKLYNVALYSAF
jgi:hypothetical protein